MKLSIADRAIILGILPKEGNFDTLKAIRKFRESLSLSEVEKQEIHWRLGFKCPKCNESIFLPVIAKCGNCGVWLDPTGEAQWDTQVDPNKEIHTPIVILNLIVSTLQKMNDKGKLTEELMPLYEKLVLSKEETNADTK